MDIKHHRNYFKTLPKFASRNMKADFFLKKRKREVHLRALQPLFEQLYSQFYTPGECGGGQSCSASEMAAKVLTALNLPSLIIEGAGEQHNRTS